MIDFGAYVTSYRMNVLEEENFALSKRLTDYESLLTVIQMTLHDSGSSRSALTRFVDERLAELNKKELREDTNIDD